VAKPKTRPAIPRALARKVKVEAGHRCAIPVCRQTPVELHHIRPWSEVKEHTFDNLIALCPTDHARATQGEIDRKAMRIYKRNLAVVNSRYGEMEHRLIDLFAASDASTAQLDRDMDFEFMYMIEDGLLVKRSASSNGSVRINGVVQGPWLYSLTEEGEDFVARWANGELVED
jgi:hypothetical protein